MSVSFSCQCGERKKPVEERNWEITQYLCNHSAFNGYHRTPSDYSTVNCRNCLAVGRTKAGYVHALKIAQDMREFVRVLMDITGVSKGQAIEAWGTLSDRNRNQPGKSATRYARAHRLINE